MSILNRGKAKKRASADKSRRSFFWKLGAGVSGALAAPAVMVRAEISEQDSASVRLALLEEEKTLRKLHQNFEQAMDKGLSEEVIEMFADDARVIFNGGLFVGRSEGVSRLYRDRFPSEKTGRRMEPAPGFELEADQQADRVDVSPDLLSATAVFPYSIQAGAAIESETSLANMARLQGEGVKTWWEGGVYHVNYRKDDVHGRWKISQLEYRTLSRADYRPGRSYARPIAVAAIATRYPEDPQGPDSLLG